MSRLFKFLLGLAAGACAATVAHADLLHPASTGTRLMSHAAESLHAAAEPGAQRLGGTLHRATERATEIVMRAMGALDTPYRLGGTSAATGFDCSGFVRVMVEEAVGLKLPRTAAEQAAATQHIDKADLRPGDLVFFNTLRRSYSHVGIYLGEGKFIHAPRTGAKVRVENMQARYWQSRFNGARRVRHIELPQPAPGSLASLAGLGAAAAEPDLAHASATQTATSATQTAPESVAVAEAVQAVPAGQGARKLAAKTAVDPKAKATRVAKAGKASGKQAKAGQAKVRTAKAGKVNKVQGAKLSKTAHASKTAKTAKGGKAGAGKKSAAAKPSGAKRRV